MIRPHADHFYYEPSEFEVMKKTVVSLKSHGADGFVFGILKRCSENARDPTNSWIDVPRNKELVQIAGRPCTFHRAFDTIPESSWENALTDIMNCGFASILTNGGPSGTKATDCVDKLQRLVRWKEAQQHSQDNSQSIKVPEIIVGGGVRTSNLGLLYRSTGASAFHSAALVGSDETACEHEIFQMKLQIS
ncbi:hypothetical protein N7457_005060 [Penicillium paradoxum]|uniref:uncharacterized protein n=1 Tax=Penicillium paradoxum TaxID=176176 RepID=UPI002546CE6E|nr:uncharacterized protein N7457_005060 [Penicillium paradoxum]KAJ5783286.1 hypothetical protein N7457_005060 [Penicillium paradoxum]